MNVTGTPAKNLTLSLEKRIKSSYTTYTGIWAVDSVYATDATGKFSITRSFDTSYYDVRLAVQGDTMKVGNVISTADAQLINQWTLGTKVPSGFDFYTGDVNGSGNISIADAYGVFGRISGRFTAWPNGVPDIKFFTKAQYDSIVAAPSTNYTKTIPGTTNFTYQILPGQADSVTYYVLIPGDANGTGYHMARLTPIHVTINPTPGTPSAKENVIDEAVNYDFPTSTIEVNVPSISVKEGNLVQLPITVKTNGKDISSLQLALLYDSTLLSFKDLVNSDKSLNWLSSFSATGGIVEWAGYDASKNREFAISDNYQVFKLEFTALKPQKDWNQSPLYTTRKFSGDIESKDLSINPTNGILVVFGIRSETHVMKVFPNPTSGEFNIDFSVKEDGNVNLSVINTAGDLQKIIIDKKMSKGSYRYNCNINNLSNGIFITSLNAKDQRETAKIIKN